MVTAKKRLAVVPTPAIVPRIAVVTHPDCEGEHPTKLTAHQRHALAQAFRALEGVKPKEAKVAVFTTSAPGASLYATCIAVHLSAHDVVECEGLLRDRHADVKDGCDCMDDYLMAPYGLVVAVVAREIAPKLVGSLSERVNRPSEYPLKFGATIVHII